MVFEEMPKMTTKLFDNAQWLGGFFVTMTAILSVTVFLFTSFQTKGDFQDYKNGVEKRLDRIETKLDTALSRAAP